MGNGVKMQQKSAAVVLLEIFVVVAILGTLTAIAIPGIGKMINRGKDEARDLELRNIQTAVTLMLYDSAMGMLKPVGPTSDMSLVLTRDTPPLVLTDYLQGLEDDRLKTDCTYNFTADGTVIQVLP